MYDIYIYDDCRCMCQQNEPSIGLMIPYMQHLATTYIFSFQLGSCQLYCRIRPHCCLAAETEAKRAERNLAETYRKTMEGQPYVSEVPGICCWSVFFLVVSFVRQWIVFERLAYFRCLWFCWRELHHVGIRKKTCQRQRGARVVLTGKMAKHGHSFVHSFVVIPSVRQKCHAKWAVKKP